MISSQTGYWTCMQTPWCLPLVSIWYWVYIWCKKKKILRWRTMSGYIPFMVNKISWMKPSLLNFECAFIVWSCARVTCHFVTCCWPHVITMNILGTFADRLYFLYYNRNLRSRRRCKCWYGYILYWIWRDSRPHSQKHHQCQVLQICTVHSKFFLCHYRFTMNHSMLKAMFDLSMSVPIIDSKLCFIWS